MTRIHVCEITHREIAEQTELLGEYTAECSVLECESRPQWAMYEQMEQLGTVQGFGVYVGGVMAGFSMVLTTVFPHYGVLAATVETLFVGGRYRDTLAGARLMRMIESYAKAKGCKAIFYSAPVGGRLEAVLGKRYARTNTVYCKPLGELAEGAGNIRRGRRETAATAAM